MKNHSIKFSLVSIALVVLVSCGKDESIEYFIDAPLRIYFDRFVDEAALRNVTIDYEALKISGDIRVIAASLVIGQCLHSEKEPNTVIIDKLYWDNSNEMEREFLVFHELGHCALNRSHLDNADTHGDCISIMTSGNGVCRIRYTAATRETLLDELFMP
jgi:hypothetical protein